MAELVDASDSKSDGRKVVGVQVPSLVPLVRRPLPWRPQFLVAQTQQAQSMSFDPDLSLLAERLARECGPALLGVVGQWTVAAQSALNEPSALERLEQLGGEVEAVGCAC